MQTEKSCSHNVRQKFINIFDKNWSVVSFGSKPKLENKNKTKQKLIASLIFLIWLNKSMWGICKNVYIKFQQLLFGDLELQLKSLEVAAELN